MSNAASAHIRLKTNTNNEVKYLKATSGLICPLIMTAQICNYKYKGSIPRAVAINIAIAQLQLPDPESTGLQLAGPMACI